MTARAKRAAAEARAIRAAADALAREAERLAKAADVQDQLAEHLAKLARLPEAVEAVKRWIAYGCTEGEAVAYVADNVELRPDTLAAYWHDAQGKMSAAKKWRRDREVMRLAALGRSNAEVGAAVGIHPKSVSRIVRAQLRGVYAENRRRELERLDHARANPDPRPLLERPAPRLRGPGG